MASGVPCIASDIPPNREVLEGGKAGLLFPLGEPDALAAAILTLTSDAELRARLTVSGQERARSYYSLEHVVPQYLKLYAELTGRNPR
jgi:glycosyltransferase involved in cell wall biosynthesis